MLKFFRSILIFSIISLSILQIEILMHLSHVKPKKLIWNKNVYSIHKPDSTLIYKQRPNLNLPYITTDTFGFKSNSTKERPTGKKVVVIGDSFVWGNTNFNETYPHYLETILRKNDENIQVINAGISGYGTDQEYILFKKIVQEIKPDIVIWNININDFYDNYNNSLFAIHKGKLIQFPAFVSGLYWTGVITNLLPNYIYNNSTLINHILYSLQYRSFIPHPSEKNMIEWSFSKMNLFFKDAKQTTDERNIKIYFFLSPDQAIVENIPNNTPKLKLQRKINSIQNISVIDLNNYMYYNNIEISDGSKNILGASIKEQTYFLDESDRFPKGDWHPNEAGNKKMAELVSKKIIED